MPQRKNAKIAANYRLSKDQLLIEASLHIPPISGKTPEDIERQIYELLATPGSPASSSMDFAKPSKRAELLVEFASVYSPESVLKYLKVHGIPDFSWAEEHEHGLVLSVRRFLQASSTVAWLFWVTDEFLSGSFDRLRQRLVSHRDGSDLVFSLRPTADDLETFAPNFAGILRIDGQEFPSAAFPFEESKLGTLGNIEAVRTVTALYLSVHIGQLVQELSPRLSFKRGENIFKPAFNVSTPYQAICYALYERACGDQSIKRCRNPHCPSPYFVVESSGSRKGRSDRVYCGRPGCQKYGHKNTDEGLGPLRRKR